jgi:hypothetical protein
MYAAYHEREIVILPKETCDEWEKERCNAAFTEKLFRGIRDLEEGRGIVKTMVELERMANESLCPESSPEGGLPGTISGGDE